MAQCGENKNPLKRGGTSQKERSLAALQPGYVSVDEHRYEDWIVFANEFAGFLDYFDAANVQQGDWKIFFTSDVSSQLGTIAVQDVGAYREEIKKRFDYLKDDENRNNIPGLEENLNDLFSALLTLSKAIDEYYLKLPEEIQLKSTIVNLIQSKLSFSLYRLLGYYKKAAEPPLEYLQTGSFTNWRILNNQVVDASVIISAGLSENWWIVKNGTTTINYQWLLKNKEKVVNADAILASITSWDAYINDVPTDDIFSSPLADGSSTPDEIESLGIQHAANHNLFSGVFDQYLIAFTRIVNEASAELEKTLTNWDGHQPHYALFLSFLKLFKYAQEQTNTITKRHLDFYYKEVLRLKLKDALPNKAHFIVELAKQVDSYLLVQDTQLKAGKDSIGKDLIYALDFDSTFSKAKVATLSSIYLADAGDVIESQEVSPPIIVQNNINRLFASPVTNSQDGLGAKLTSTINDWHPFVHKEFQESRLVEIAMPKSTIGFAIASHYLYLTEGNRQVFVNLVTSANSTLMGKRIECYLTTAKGWYKVVSPAISTSTLVSSVTTLCARISFTLTGDLPAIENYNSIVHGGTFNCSLPILKIQLLHDDLVEYEYELLKNITISKVEIQVKVGMESGYNQGGLKTLLLASDAGALDASKPFMPFGSQPKTDSTFVIGNKEVFSKKNSEVKLNIEWAGLPGASDLKHIKYDAGLSTDTPLVDIRFLSGKVWTNTKDPVGSTTVISTLSSVAIVNATPKEVIVFTSAEPLPVKGVVPHADPYLPFSSASSKGFLQLRLKSDFGHKAYLDDLTLYLIDQSKITPTKTKPNEPYTPLIQSLYLSYSAYQSVDLNSSSGTNFNEREIRFFHIYPFGESEQHNYLNIENNIPTNVFLLPQFKHMDGIDTVYHRGEFYLGIENIEAGQAVNILFQVVEGSTDPLVAKPLQHIKWSYLSNNFWVDFLDQEISDSTLALLQSGIISYAIPSKASTNNTMLSSGKIWIRAAINDAAGAIPNLLSVDAQAGVSTFQSNDNAEDFLNQALPPNQITKLKIPDASIKKINQPYSSFGGRPKESEDHFYIRVSERLRHKARAITIWDYERLILEAFPEIYRVKCLNHTGVFQSGSSESTNEIQPGHVLITTIPLLTNRNEANPLKPYTNQDVLTKIENYLKERISCFVTVKARQPLFEEVGISFSLKLYEQFKDFTFYSNMLKDAIMQYLTPWAFTSDADIQFGGKIFKSSLINFIEEQYYVDFITDVILSHKIGNTITQDETIEEIIASTARSILVSVPASKHIVNPIGANLSSAVDDCVSVSSMST